MFKAAPKFNTVSLMAVLNQVETWASCLESRCNRI